MKRSVQVTGFIIVGCALLLAQSAVQRSEPPGIVELHVPSFDGAFVGATLRKPDGKGPFPAILFIHGGLGGSGIKAAKIMIASRVPEHFLTRGYVIMATDYRRYHFGDDEFGDVLAAYDHLQSYPFVDKTRIAVIGGSHGGYLTQMLLTKRKPAAAVSFAGVTDIEEMVYDLAQEQRKTFANWQEWKELLTANAEDRKRLSTRADRGEVPPSLLKLNPGRFEASLELAWRFGDRRELYREISPLSHLDEMAGPLLYLVGSEDELHISGKKLVDALKERGVTAEYSEHAGMPHGFYWGFMQDPPRQFYDALKVTTEFVERYMKR